MIKIGIETLLPGDYYEIEFDGKLFEFVSQFGTSEYGDSGLDFVYCGNGLYLNKNNIISIYEIKDE